MSDQPQPLLQVRHLSMLYGGVAALSDVCFDVVAGEVYGILGEERAGKTTLMKILGGYIPAGAYSGEIVLAGQPLALRSIRDGLQHGVALVPRLLAVFDHMSVADNATMASGELKRGFSLARRHVHEQAAEIFHRWDIHLNPGMPVAALSPLQRRQLMIANALGSEPLLVVLDEPLAGMPDGGSISGVIRLIRRMAERGVACLCLAKRPFDATLVADRISVLRDGALAGQWLRQDFDESVLAAAMASQRAYDPDARQRHDDFAPRRGMFDHWFKGPRNPN